ncbi:MAG TPA: hypothetical protein RMG45_12805 [Polyangiaceae bacterium LLY-WYZ-15_(1-7)]|nr:hypothetical protein [Polyangiaceae bacterium LLY-WYZ-15_(1-7)]
MQPHALLAASLLALAAGPLLHAALRRTPGGRRILQWAVLGAVAFLVLGHVLPECLEACGAIALVVAAVGFALPAAAERVVEARWARSSVWLGVAVLGLAAHALIDGVALGLGEAGGHGHESHGHHEHAMGLAVVLHRLPVAAGLWGLLAKRSVAAAGGRWC